MWCLPQLKHLDLNQKVNPKTYFKPSRKKTLKSRDKIDKCGFMCLVEVILNYQNVISSIRVVAIAKIS